MEKILYCARGTRGCGVKLQSSSLQEKLEGPTLSDSRSCGLQVLFHEMAYIVSSPRSPPRHFP